MNWLVEIENKSLGGETPRRKGGKLSMNEEQTAIQFLRKLYEQLNMNEAHIKIKNIPFTESDQFKVNSNMLPWSEYIIILTRFKRLMRKGKYERAAASIEDFVGCWVMYSNDKRIRMIVSETIGEELCRYDQLKSNGLST